MKTRMKKSLIVFFVSIIFLVGVSSLNPTNAQIADLEGSATTSLDIVTTIAVPYDIVKEVAGEDANISSIVDSATDIHTFTGPTQQQINDMIAADVIFSMGISGAEPWFQDVVDDNGLQSKVVPLADVSVDGEADPLLDGQKNPHVWMNPEVVKKMVNQTTVKLTELDAVNQATFEANNATFQTRLDKLLDNIDGNKTAYFDGQKVVVNHPAFFYLFNKLGLDRIESLETHSSGYTGQAAINDIIEQINSETGDVILITSPQHSRSDMYEIARNTGSKIADMSAIPGVYEHWILDDYSVPDYISMIEYCMWSLRNPQDPPEESIPGYSIVFLTVGIGLGLLILRKRMKIQ